MYYRMDPAKETQLVGYYPMEVSKYDGFAQRVDSFTTRNLAYNAYEGSDLLVGSEGVAPTPSELAPGLKSAPKTSTSSTPRMPPPSISPSAIVPPRSKTAM